MKNTFTWITEMFRLNLMTKFGWVEEPLLDLFMLNSPINSAFRRGIVLHDTMRIN
jgi:hypothetical protein